MVTAPVHKGIINDAGIPFTGHTEFLAGQTHTDLVVMMLVGGGIRVALATTHLPLKDVPAAITAPLLENVLRIIRRDLQSRFGIAQPRILVAGLNPHAGEGGYLGREEIEVMIPLLDRLRASFDPQKPSVPETKNRVPVSAAATTARDNEALSPGSARPDERSMSHASRQGSAARTGSAPMRSRGGKLQVTR